MPYYRLCLTDASGHITKSRDFDSASDGEAVERVSDLRKGASAELWQERRWVESFVATGDPSSARAN
jgi:hypothetical protein